MRLTTAQKQEAYRGRLSFSGLFKRREVWVHPHDLPAIRKLEAELREERIKAEGYVPDQYCL